MLSYVRLFALPLLIFLSYTGVQGYGGHAGLPEGVRIDKSEANEFLRLPRQATCVHHVNYEQCVTERSVTWGCTNTESGREYLCSKFNTMCPDPETLCVPGNLWCPDCNNLYCADLCETKGPDCLNGGVCRSISLTNYYCICPAGYTGINCGIDINECESNPCKNQGNCTDGINGYTCTCSSRYTGWNCQLDRCKLGPADIIFLVDSSVSQGPDNFNKQLEFIKDFIKQVYIGPNAVQISIITFSFDSQVEFELKHYSNNETLLAAIDNIAYTPGATYTGAALFAARSVFQGGRTSFIIDGLKFTVQKRVIVLTDGMSSDRVNMRDQAFFLREAGVDIVAVGIGSEILHEELLEMASHYSKVFTVSTHDGLNGILLDIGNYVCEACSNKLSDLLYLLDASSSVSLSEFQGALDVLQYITSLLTVGSDKTRISLVKYAEEPELLFDFQKYTSVINIHKEIQVMRQRSGHANHSKAFEYVHQSGFTTERGTRDGERQIVVLLTNGNGVDSAAMDLAENLKNDGKIIVTVGYGSGIARQKMLNIASYPYMFFNVGQEQYTETTVLSSLKTLFEYHMCKF